MAENETQQVQPEQSLHLARPSFLPTTEVEDDYDLPAKKRRKVVVEHHEIIPKEDDISSLSRNLFQAVINGDLPWIRRLLQNSSTFLPFVNIQDHAGYNALHIAVTRAPLRKKHKIIKTLLRNGGDVNMRNNRSETVVDLAIEVDAMYASSKIEKRTMDLLFDKEKLDEETVNSTVSTGSLEDVQRVSKKYQSIGNFVLDIGVLHSAVSRGSFPIVEYLLRSRAFDEDSVTHVLSNLSNRNLLHVCVINTLHLEYSPDKLEERRKIIVMLHGSDGLEEFENLYRHSLLEIEDDLGNPPLLMPNIHLELIKCLIEQGANVTNDSRDGRTLLHKACTYLNADQYHELIVFLISRIGAESTANAFRKICDKDKVPLHCAVEIITKETLDLIMTLPGVDLNAKDKDGDTVIYYAILFQRDEQFLDALVSHGADLNLQSHCGGLLHVAAYYRNLEAMQYFISKGFSVNGREIVKGTTPLYCLIAKRGDSEDPDGDTANLDAVKLLLDNGLDLAAPNVIDHHKSGLFKITLLFRWHDRDLMDLLKLLVSHGGDVITHSDNSLMLFATESPTPEMYHEIAEFMIDIRKPEVFSQKSRNGYTPLHGLVEQMEPLVKTLELFRSLGVDFDTKTDAGFTPLITAVCGGRKAAFLKTLVTRFGVDMRISDNYGNGPLHHAAYCGNLEALQVLSELGVCDVNARNHTEDTPLHMSQQCRRMSEDLRLEIVKQLIAMGADGSLRNSELQTPFDVASDEIVAEETLHILRREKLDDESILFPVYNGNLDEIKKVSEICVRRGKLLKNFWQMNSLKKEISPLHVAMKKGDLEMVQYLLEDEGYKEILDDIRFSSLLHGCIRLTSDFPEARISSRKQIINLLVGLNKKLLYGERDKIPCLSACRIHIDLITQLIQLGADPQAEDWNGISLLYSTPSYLDEEDYHEMVECLSKKGLLDCFMKRSASYISPLHSAVRKLNLLEETIRLVWESGVVDFNAVDAHGNSLLFNAIDGKRTSDFIAMLILKFGVICGRCNKNDENALHRLARHPNPNPGGTKNAALVKLLISKGCDLNGGDQYAFTPLHWAVREIKPDWEMVRELLENGADVKPVRLLGYTALHYLVRSSQKYQRNLAVSLTKYEGFCLLVEYGTNVQCRDEQGRTMLHYADELHSEAYFCICSKIVSMGESSCLSVADNDGRTILHSAVLGKLELSRKTLELLISHGVNINAKENLEGNSVLHSAVDTYGSDKFISLLIELGADCKVKNKVGQIPLHIAASKGRLDIVSILLKHAPTTVNEKDLAGNTPLLCAVMCPLESSEFSLCNESIVVELITHGADFWAMNRRGRTISELMQGR